MKGRVSSVCKFLPIFDTNDRWKFLAINKESLWSWSIPWTVKKGVCNKEDQRFKGMPIDRSVLETRYMEEWMVKDWRARYRANKFNTSSSIFKGFMSRRDPLIKVLSVDKTDRRCSSGKTTMMAPERRSDICQLYSFPFIKRDDYYDFQQHRYTKISAISKT